MKPKYFFILFFSLILADNTSVYSQNTKTDKISYDQSTYYLYPATIDTLPELPSPLKMDDGMEILLTALKDNKYALIPVTVENGTPLHYSLRVKDVFGKDLQLHINSGDFPALAKTGLHSVQELSRKEMITGFPVSLINYIGRPGRFSGAGFLAEDEDIITVLQSDNNIVAKLGLTHPGMAKPLFHVWNIILYEIELGKWARYWDNIKYFYYNGNKVALKAKGTKGWQISIFQDEIQGRFDLEVSRSLSDTEKLFLKEKYPSLSASQLEVFENKLSTINFSEMLPYYIMRYGFYEGHTDYRSDPVAIAFIFGLKSLEVIEKSFPGSLYLTLTNHFLSD
ncbi:MAG: hypothetical protein K9I69_05135 [Ignavibacteriales bacterium]|nr:hypothetical protein [Ignavibacteriales bacterium]MCF8306143.1 hypothetical protein [Ignavibacteriales bacterium]MCF8315803.1 hypothetical protein [Ignavibacteriales bacterium]MCF8437263.1 hypothetical protein [Ignavibacteriales bacterium]